jgi:hypothetical protein
MGGTYTFHSTKKSFTEVKNTFHHSPRSRSEVIQAFKNDDGRYQYPPIQRDQLIEGNDTFRLYPRSRQEVNLAFELQ